MKKLLAVLLTVCLVSVMCPFSVSAASVVASGNCGAQGGNVKWSLDSEGTLTISGNGAMKDYREGWYENEGWDPEPSFLWSGGTDYRKSVKKIIIQNGVTSIGNDVFSLCVNLRNVTISGRITKIGSYAFSRCRSLTGITLPNSITTLPEGVFERSGLRSFSVPDSVTSIGYDAFGGSDLTDITLPYGLKSIGESAFSYTDITQINIPGSVTSIGKYAFSNTKLIEIVIPNSVSSLGSYAFKECSNLTKATLSNRVTVLDYGVFGHCSSLTDVLIPTSVTQIKQTEHDINTGNMIILNDDISTFYGCTSLRNVYYSGSEAQWKKMKIGEGNEALNSATKHYNSTSMRPTVGGFKDVYEGDFYADPVVWAVGQGITGGKGNGKFAPKDSCTRGEIVTFLWRAAGQPEPTITENPFADVKESDFFYKPVLWAAGNNVTGGTGTNEDGKALFSPGNSCTRAQAMTFQWRAAGEPTPSTSGTFADVPSGSYYADAVSWALENEITNGTGGGKFGSGNSCTRGQIVTFLYRGRDVA